MTNQTPQNSRPPKDERQDELIAVLVALGAIGTIFFWGFNRIGNGTKFASQLEGTPLAAEVDGDQGSLLASGADGSQNEGGFLGALGLGDGDASSDRSSAGDGINGDANTGPLNNAGLASIGTAVGGSVLMSPGGSDSDIDATDTATADAGADATDEDATAGDATAEDTVDETVDAESGVNANDTTAESTAAGEEQIAAADLDDNSQDAAESLTDSEDGEEDPAPDEDASSEANNEEEEPAELAVDVPVEGFSDIDKDYWASPFIEGLRQKNVATGFVGGNFEPDTPVSRSQFAAQIYRAFAQDSDTRELDYSDLPSSHPQYAAIGEVTKSGFMSGYPEGDFRPNDKVSKLEVLIALASGLDLNVPSDPENFLSNYYGDVSQIPDWAFPKIAAATQAGLVVNYDDLRSLNPSQPATRAEASAMLYQALVNLGEAPEVESDYVVKP